MQGDGRAQRSRCMRSGWLAGAALLLTSCGLPSSAASLATGHVTVSTTYLAGTTGGQEDLTWLVDGTLGPRTR